MEVAVIGAGLAGLEAARILAERGIEVEVFEATHRIGGRVRTEHHDDILPIELGPEFIHGGPRILTSLLRGAPIALDELTETYFQQRDGQLVEGGDMWRRMGELLAGARDRVDRSARRYVEQGSLDPEDARALAMFVEGFYAAPLDDISIRNVVEDAGGIGGGDERSQKRVHGGYGEIVDWLGDRIAEAGVIVHHGCAVHRVSWSHASARIDYRSVTGDRSISARRVVIALPLGVLKATGPERVEFVPDLTGHRAAITHLGMGQVVKLVVCLREPLWQADTDLAFVMGGGERAFPTYWVRSGDGRYQLTAWAGGRHALALAGLGADELAERALEDFAKATGVPPSEVAGALLHYHFHDYQADPWARGAYSYVRVGERHAPHELARPLADTLYFAGEATSANYEGTVTGALGSGNRAANRIMQAMRA